MLNQETIIVKKLIESRKVLLVGSIDDEMSRDVAEQLLVMDQTCDKPIQMIINSSGGYIDSGLFLIDVMNGLRSPVYTIIIGQACSMAGIISVCGDKRYITEHSVWMGHEGTYGNEDYLSKLKDRHDFYMNTEKNLNKLLTKYTKLTENDLEKMRRGELWLSPEQCLAKSIVDEVLGMYTKRHAKAYISRF